MTGYFGPENKGRDPQADRPRFEACGVCHKPFEEGDSGVVTINGSVHNGCAGLVEGTTELREIR